MALNKVEICGVNTANLPLLKEEEKEKLFARIKAGDEEAKEKYIEGNLRLVLSVIKRFSGSNENADDLFQIGCIGLIKAINNFNTELNVKFSTYAVPMIIGEIRRYMRDNNSIRVSRSLRDTAYKAIYARESYVKNHFSTYAVPMIIGEIRRYMRDNNSIRVSRSLRDTAYKAIYARESYVKNHLKEPTIEEISTEIGIAKEDIVQALDAIQIPMSLQEPVYNDGGDTLYVMDQLSDKKNKEDTWIEELALEAAMNHLGEREKSIIQMRFFEGRTQMEIAKDIHISQAQVSRLEKNALKTMRQYLA